MFAKVEIIILNVFNLKIWDSATFMKLNDHF